MNEKEERECFDRVASANRQPSATDLKNELRVVRLYEIDSPM